MAQKPEPINFDYEGDELIQKPKGRTGAYWIVNAYPVLNFSEKVKATDYLEQNGHCHHRFNSLSSFLMLGFSWEDTEEGYDFWFNKYDQAQKLESKL